MANPESKDSKKLKKIKQNIRRDNGNNGRPYPNGEIYPPGKDDPRVKYPDFFMA